MGINNTIDKSLIWIGRAILKAIKFTWYAVLISLLYFLVLACVAHLFSCSKSDYIEHPTCRRYIEVSDKFDGDMNYIRTDTLWPNGRIANEVCNADLDSMRAYVPNVEGCPTGGYQEFRYLIG